MPAPLRALARALVAGPASAQLCPPAARDVPCVVATSTSLPSGSVVDLGARTLIVRAGRGLRVGAPGLLVPEGRPMVVTTTQADGPMGIGATL